MKTENRVTILKSTKKWAECGCCGAFHPSNYWGDCRNDDNRFWYDELPEDADIEYLDCEEPFDANDMSDPDAMHLRIMSMIDGVSND